ncbi:hypothetical protein [Pantoea sp. A4]|uniref:hypothetical protein n=1 Tax=Pantoea sp. A4 TaxID=1225184 RepID=UPI000375A738|nr:hypothetical protein [Pantoea sp. A4]
MLIHKKRRRVYSANEVEEVIKIETHQLGKPYNQIPAIFKNLRDQIDTRLNVYFLKKLRVNTTLIDIQCHSDVIQKKAQIFSSESGHLALYIDRHFLLQILYDYYGLKRQELTEKPLNDGPLSRTEERLQSKISSDLIQLLLSDTLFGQPLTLSADYAALMTQWAYRVDFILDSYQGGKLSLLLDASHVDLLLANLRAKQNQNRPKRLPTRPLFSTLPLRLKGRLTTLSLPTARLSTLQAGDILPIALAESVPLYIGSNSLFSASVCEDRGKLYFCDLIRNREHTDD